MSDNKILENIRTAKQKLGKRLVILGHHYQREEVIKFADFRGDSYGLSKIASEQKDAEFIVFCGVHFMAEAAKILARPNQRVFLPDPTAGCPMADMASVDDVEDAWTALSKVLDIKKVIPVTYMNSVAALKAFCGRNNGVVCTSGNASKVFDWAFNRGKTIFFFPDEHLGRNTARKKGIARDEIVMWNKEECHCERNAKQSHAGDCFGNSLAMTKLILWPGFCHVHTFFTTEHVREARKNYPDCKIVVHPECREDVVTLCDESGSTEGICNFVKKQEKGSTIIIGTEINLVARLARENPEKNIVPLARSLCPNMFKTSPESLARVLDSIIAEKYMNEIIITEDIQRDAKVALERMLSL